MKYLVRKSIVQIIGGIWWPMGQVCAMQKELSSYDVNNCRDNNGKITRESVERWVLANSGDFSSVKDFAASIEDGENTIEIPWANEENGVMYEDCTAEV